MKQKILSTLEYLLAGLMIVGGLDTVTESSVTGPRAGALAQAFGSQLSLSLFGFAFLCVGISLLFSKVMKNERLRENSLIAAYLFNIFVGFLAMAAFGFFAFDWVDTIVFGLIAAGLWLNVKKSRRGWNWPRLGKKGQQYPGQAQQPPDQ